MSAPGSSVINGASRWLAPLAGPAASARTTPAAASPDRHGILFFMPVILPSWPCGGRVARRRDSTRLRETGWHRMGRPWHESANGADLVRTAVEGTGGPFEGCTGRGDVIARCLGVARRARRGRRRRRAGAAL